MLQPLDGPATQDTLTLTSATVQEARVGGSAFSERKVVTLQADQKFYVYFGDGTSTPSAATVAADGIEIAKSAIASFEASDKQPLFVLAVSTTANLKVVERA